MLIFNPDTEQYEPTPKEYKKMKETLSADEYYKFIRNKNVSIEELKEAKVAQLDYWCNLFILSGFESDALGEPHQYKFDYEAQINILGTEREFEKGTITQIYWNTVDSGQLLHTKEQFAQVYRDAFSHKNNMTARYWELKNQAFVLETKEEIDLINW